MTNGASFIIFSGGTACNHIARAFHDSVANDVCYVLGISDNGGSSVNIVVKLSEEQLHRRAA